MTAFIGRREFITLLGGAARVAARGASAAAGDAGDRISRNRVTKFWGTDISSISTGPQ